MRRNHSPLAALALLAACGGDTHVTDDLGNYALRREGANVAVTPAYRDCTGDTDCVLVNVTCNACCERDAIAASLTSEYQSAHADACEGYSGAVCDCAPQPLRAVCVDSRCATAPDDEPDAGPADEDAAACEAVNEAIVAEMAALRACNAPSDCGQELPTLGSCGCTHNAVGRLDADTTRISELLAQRDALAHVPACALLGGSCDCPPVGGVDCQEGLCTWLRIDDDDPCAALDGTFKSLEELECGPAPEGMEALCKWSLTFHQGLFDWSKSDYGLSGHYTCLDGSITAQVLNETYAGTIAADGTLSFDGVSYAR